MRRACFKMSPRSRPRPSRRRRNLCAKCQIENQSKPISQVNANPVWSASPCQYRLVYSMLLLLTYWKQIWRKTTKNPKSHHKSFHRRQSPYSAISTPTRTCVRVPMIIWVSPNEPPKTPPPTHIRNHNHTHANTDCLTFYNYLYHAPTYPNKLGKLSTTHTHTHFKLLI